MLAYGENPVLEPGAGGPGRRGALDGRVRRRPARPARSGTGSPGRSVRAHPARLAAGGPRRRATPPAGPASRPAWPSRGWRSRVGAGRGEVGAVGARAGVDHRAVPSPGSSSSSATRSTSCRAGTSSGTSATHARPPRSRPTRGTAGGSSRPATTHRTSRSQAFLFGVLTSALREAAAKHPEWARTRHEDLCIDTVPRFRALAAEVGLVWGDGAERFLTDSDREGTPYRTQRRTEDATGPVARPTRRGTDRDDSRDARPLPPRVRPRALTDGRRRIVRRCAAHPRAVAGQGARSRRRRAPARRGRRSARSHVPSASRPTTCSHGRTSSSPTSRRSACARTAST